MALVTYARVRKPDVRVWSSALLLAAFASFAVDAAAQLRPLPPVDWRALDATHGAAYLGVSGFTQQPVSLVGQQGRLLQWGMVGAAYKTGRVMLSFEGSIVRVFVAGERFADPSPLVESVDLARRTDSGDYVINTHLLLTSGLGDRDALIRFGVRLPTTDHRVGLERDQTDFFATLAGRQGVGRLFLDGELGFGIHGVAGPRHNQTDPILFGLRAAYHLDRVEASFRLGGQYDTREHGPPRGNEHLAELTWGIRTTGVTWASLELIRGLALFSPSWGASLRVGRAF